jgi:hypothetical protein
MEYSSIDIDTDTDTDTDTMTYIEEPNENDILLGRGGKNNQWTGNDGLRIMAHSRCIEYQTAQKKAKSEISRELVEGVQNLDPPGRFLRKCSNTKGSIRWEVATDKVAREKTSQVLRDAIHAKKLLNSLGERHTGIKASPNSKDDDDDDDNDDDDDDAGSGSSSTTAGISVAKEEGEDVVHNKMKKTPGSVSSSTAAGSAGKVRKEEGEEADNKMKRTPLKKSSEQGCQTLPASASASASVTSAGSSNSRLPIGNRPTEHTFSPDTFLLPHPYTSSYGYSSSYGRVPISEASLNRRYSREDASHFALGSSSFPYQYPVTPSSSNIAISTAKKRRQRYCQESPLVHGYHHYDPCHQYPYPTPIRQNAPPPAGMRPVSMGTSPPNTKLRGLKFSPPAIPMHGMLPEHSCNAPFSSERRSSSSLSQITVKQEDDYTNNKMGRGLVFSPPAISVHGMISGNSCSSVDTPFSSDKRSLSTLQIKVKQEDNSTSDETIQLPSTSNQQSHLSTTDSRGSNPEFDFLLNDDVLSDSEHKSHSATSFPSDLHDDSI